MLRRAAWWWNRIARPCQEKLAANSRKKSGGKKTREDALPRQRRNR
jgi:hypothetical protein